MEGALLFAETCTTCHEMSTYDKTICHRAFVLVKERTCGDVCGNGMSRSHQVMGFEFRWFLVRLLLEVHQFVGKGGVRAEVML